MSVVRSPPFVSGTLNKFPTVFTFLLLFLSTSVFVNPVFGQDDHHDSSELLEDSMFGSTIDSTPVASHGTVIVSSTSLSSDHGQDHEEHHVQGGDDEENQVGDQDPALAAATMDDEDESCPCAARQDCPRIYGSDPIDFTTLGQLPPCKQAGYVRCCGVSVSVVQKTDELVDEHGAASASDENEESSTATWELGHEEDSASGENSSSHDQDISSSSAQADDEDILHSDSQGQPEKDLQQEQQPDILDDNEDSPSEEDNIPAESRQTAPQILEPPQEPHESQPRKRFQARHKFQKKYSKDEESSSAPQVVESYTTSNEETTSSFPRRKTFSPSLRSPKFQSPPSTSSSYASTVYPTEFDGSSGGGGDGDSTGGSVVYSQRVSQYTPYRSRTHSNRNGYSKVSESTSPASPPPEDNLDASSSPPTNGENSQPSADPRFPARRRRPLNQMRNRPHYQHQQQQDTELSPGEISPSSESTVYGASSSGQSSSAPPLHVPVDEQEAIISTPDTASQLMTQQDELDNSNQERRPMSRLVKPTRVNGLHHRRRKQQLAGNGNNKLGGENGESLYPDSDNSYGESPTAAQTPTELDNGEQGKDGNDDDSSKATIGSSGEVEGPNGNDGAAAKLLANSPTGKLIPVRPKTRPFNRNKGEEETQGWSSPSSDLVDGGNDNVSGGGGGDASINHYESQTEEAGPSNDLVKSLEQQQQQQINNGVVNIRRLPMRRVQPKVEVTPEETGGIGGGGGGDDENGQSEVPVTQTTSPVSPVRGRIVMRRPMKHLEASAPSQPEDLAQPEVESATDGESGENVVEKLDVRKRLRGRPRPNLLKSSSVATPPIPEISPEVGLENLDAGSPGADAGPVDGEAPPESPIRSPLLRKRVRPAALENLNAGSPGTDAAPTGEEEATPESPVRSPLLRKRVRPAVIGTSNAGSPGADSVPVAEEASPPVPPFRSPLLRKRIRPAALENLNAGSPGADAAPVDEIEANPEPPVRSPLLRKRIRPAALENLNAGSPGADDAPAAEEVEATPEPQVTSPLLRKRVRPAILRRGPNQQNQNDNSATEAGAELSENPVPSSDLENTADEQQATDKPSRGNIIRTRGRLPFIRNHQNPPTVETVQNNKEDETTTTTDATPEVGRPSLLQRQRQNRLSSRRGNSRHPLSNAAADTAPDSAIAPAEDANPATSESPVTVTSTYSRIRTNSKNSLLTRPIYRRPTYVPPSTTPVPTSTPASGESPALDEYENSGTRTRFGQKTRFRVPTKSGSHANSQAAEVPTVTVTINSPAAAASDATPTSDDNEIEKQGQLNEQSNINAAEDYPSGGGGRRKVGFVRRKMVRGRPKQQQQQEDHQQQQQQQELAQDEKKPEGGGGGGESYEEAGSNPETPQNSEHVSSPAQPEVAPESGEIQDTSHQLNHGNGSPPVDSDQISVQIHPAGSGSDGGQDGAQEETEENYEGDSNKQGGAGADGIADDDNSDDIDSTSSSGEPTDQKTSNPGNYNYPDDSHRVVSNQHVDADSDTYDLILDQDVRKTLGTQHPHQYTHHLTQNSDGEHLSSAYKSPHDAYSVNQQGGNGGGGDHQQTHRLPHHPQQQQQQQQAQDDDYSSYYDTPDDETQHKYSTGVTTLEMGTPDYDPNPGQPGADDSTNSGQYYWQQQGYENLEDEEESRVHVKYLKNKSSSESIDGGSPSSSLSQNESSNNYNNNNGDSSSKSPVNPSLESLSAATSSDEDLKRERNRQRIRQKLRRPQSAYINNSDNSSSDHEDVGVVRNRVRSTTTIAPFSPSLQSPRPTYSGQQALLESVHQSKSTSAENPNSQQLEQFIEQNNNKHASPTSPPTRNRSRVRVKLVTLKTTTPAPVVAPGTSDNYNEDDASTNHHDRYSSEHGAPDASSSPSAPSNEVKTNPRQRNKFIFPPFRKSELTLIPSSTEATTEEAAEHSGGGGLTYTRIPSPQRVVFRPGAGSTSHYSPPSTSTTTTTTTTTTPAPRKPLRNYNYHHNNNNNDNTEESSNYSSMKTKGSSSLEETVTSPGKSRFKVNSLNKPGYPSSRPSHSSSYSPSTPSIEPIKQAPPPSSPSSPVTRKPQPRIKSPNYNRRLPSSLPTTTTTTTTTTTESPVVIHHRAPVTASPPLYYSSLPSAEDQLQRQKQPLYQKPTPAAVEEPEAEYPAEGDDEENVISIRITDDNQDSSSSVIDHQDQDENLVEPPRYQYHPQQHQEQQQQRYPQQQQQQYYQQEKEIPQSYLSAPLPPPPPPPASPSIPSYETPLAPINKYNGKKQAGEKGKYSASNRFKVPEKFELQKPHLLPSSNNNNINNNEDFGEAFVRKPYISPGLSASIGEPSQVPVKPQQQAQYQQTQQPANNLYGGNIEINYNEPAPQPPQHPPQQQEFVNKPVIQQGVQVQARPEPEDFEDEEEQEMIVPDIKINVLPLPSPPEQQQQQQLPQQSIYTNNNNYDNSNEMIQNIRAPPQQPPFNMLHAVREPQPPPQQQYYRPEPLQAPPSSNRFTPVLKNSPFGPFPSTDHWSGIPSSNSPRLPDYFEQNRLPNHPPPQEQQQQHQNSYEFENNEFRRPPPTHLFEQRPIIMEQRPPPPPPSTKVNSDIRFVENYDAEEDDSRVQEYAPPVPVQSTQIKFGTEFEDDVDGEEEEVRVPSQRPMEQRPPVNTPNRVIPVSPPFQQFAPNSNNQEFIQNRPVLGGNQEIQINSVLPPNEQQLINVHRQPSPTPLQEPLILPGIPPNSVVVPPPTNPVSIEIKDGELVSQHFPQENVNDHPPARQPPHQQINQRPPVLPPQQQQQQIQFLNGNPPPQILRENVISQERLREPLQQRPQQQPPPRFPQMNSQFAPDQNPNIIVQVDGIPHDAVRQNIPPPPPSAQGHLQLQKPLERPTGIEIEPEIKILSQKPPPLQTNPNFPTLIPEGHQPNIRDQVQIQQHPPRQQQQLPSPGGVKFPEFGDHHPARPGQFGPPPLGQQRLPQYVPFNYPPMSDPNKGKRNESGGDVLLHQRPPVLPPPPQTFQNPFKFNGGPQPNQQRFPQQLPLRQNYNGNFMNPQQFNPHQPRPHQQPQMPMMRAPPSQFGAANPHHFQQPPHHPRLRNPGGMRTSRAANLTAEEAKDDEITASGRVDVPKQEFVGEPESKHEEVQSPREASQITPAESPKPIPQQLNAVDLTISLLEKVALVGQQERQQRELNLENKELSTEPNAGKVEKKTSSQIEAINEESFVQDQLPEESQESPSASPIAKQSEEDIANLYHIIPPSELKQPGQEGKEEKGGKMSENHGDNPLSSSVAMMMKSGKQKKLLLLQEQQQHKAKLEMGGKGVGEQQDGRLVAGENKRTLSQESKKSILKMKSILKDKNVGELEESQTKGNTNKKEQQLEKEMMMMMMMKSKPEEKSQSSDEIQQDFVAPKVIQRGFHPILPYSEQDPGPIRVQMMNLPIPAAAKVEKFLPPFGLPVITAAGQTMEPTINRVETSPNNNNGASLPIMSTSVVEGGNGGSTQLQPLPSMAMMGPGKLGGHFDQMMFHNNINKHLLSGNIPVIMMQPNALNHQQQQQQQSLPNNNLA